MSPDRAPSRSPRAAGSSIGRLGATVILSTAMLLAGAGAAQAAPLQGTGQIDWVGQAGDYRSHVAVVGDVNADGKDDIAFGRGNSVTVLYGSASPLNIDLDAPLGTRGLRLTLPRGSVADVEPAGDFDADGNDDLVISTGSNAYVFYGKPGAVSGDLALAGSGRVTDITTLTIGGGNLPGSGIGDFSGDGIDDLAVAGNNVISVILGGARANAINANVTAARVSRITGGQTCGRILLFIPMCSSNGLLFEPVGDFNGDGKADLAINNNAAYVLQGKRHILFGRSGTSNIPGATPSNAMVIPSNFGEYLPKAMGDVNGDGRDDVAFRYTQNIYLGVANPPATLDGTSPKVSVTNTTVGQPIGDQNGDGRDDLAVYGYSETDPATSGLRVIGFPTGQGGSVDAMSAPLIGGLPFGSNGIGAGDLDGDGIDDLLAWDERSDRYSVATRGTDTVAPSLTAATITPARFTPTEGSRVAVELDEAATVETTFRKGGGVVATERRSAPVGESDVRFTGVVNGSPLGAGSYAASVVAIDAAGNRSAAQTFDFEILGEGTAASASLSLRTTLVRADGINLTYEMPAVVHRLECGTTKREGLRFAPGIDEDLGSGLGLRAGESCSLDSSLDFTYSGSSLRDCRWTDSYTFNGAPAGAGPYTLKDGANRWERLRTCSFDGTEMPRSIDEFRASTSASIESPGVARLTAARANETGSLVWEKTRDYNGRTIEFESRMQGGNGGESGLTLAFLNPGSQGEGGQFFGRTGQFMGFGGGSMTGVALALDVSRGANDPSGNFIGWTDGARGDGLNWLQTADAGIRLRSTAWIKVKVVFANGKAQVFVNGSLRMERTMTLPAKTHIGFTASTGSSTYQTHHVRLFKVT